MSIKTTVKIIKKSNRKGLAEERNKEMKKVCYPKNLSLIPD